MGFKSKLEPFFKWNKYLVQLSHKLGYIENYSSGLNRIFKEYYDNKEQPIIETTLNMFKITFPNLNYHFNEAQNEVQNEAQNEVQKNTTLELQIIDLIRKKSNITKKEMSDKIGKSKSTIERAIRASNKIKFIGFAKSGHWEITE